MEPLRHDLQYAARKLLRLTIFTLLIVVAFALSAGATPLEDQSEPHSDQTEKPDRRTFWERVFRMAPLRKRLEKALVEEWKFAEVRPRHVDEMLSDDAEEIRAFFMSGSNARQYHRLVREFGIGFETKDGKVVDESIETLSEYGPELIQKYPILMENRETIKRYFAGVF